MIFKFIFALLFITANNLSALSEAERECFDTIFRPAELAHTMIHERIIAVKNVSMATSNDDDDEDDSKYSTSETTDAFNLEAGIPEMPPFDVDHNIVKILAQDLTPEEIAAIGIIMGRFVDYLTLEGKFHDAYDEQLKNIRYTILVAGGSLIVFLAALIPLGLAELGQMTCDDYECVFDDDSMIVTKNGDGPTHFCGHNGQNFDCLEFFATALGNVDLTEATYQPGCSKLLDPALVNETISLAQIRHYKDTTCQTLIGLIPLIDAACLALPTAVAGYTVKKGFDLKKLRRKVEASKQEPADFDSWPFRTGLAKMANISPKLKTYVELAGNTCSLGDETDSPIGTIFRNSPFHLLVEQLLERAGFGSTIKAAWKSF